MYRVFEDRRAAGRALVPALQRIDLDDPIILGLPRGGVPLAYEIAVALRAPLWVLALGYLLHGLWDMLHGAVLPHVMPEWYAPLCIGYDITLALLIFRRYRVAVPAAA